MAVTVTPVTSSSGIGRNLFTFIVTVTATADGDTTATVTFPTLPASAGRTAFELQTTDTICIITPILQVAASLSLWAMTALSGTAATLTKATTAGSGVAGPQIRAQFMAPQSMAR